MGDLTTCGLWGLDRLGFVGPIWRLDDLQFMGTARQAVVMVGAEVIAQ